MRVLSVVDGKGWTGGVEQAFLLTRELRDRGVEASLAVHRDNPVLDEARSAGLDVMAYDRGAGRLSRVARLREILSGRYDVVIGHKPAAIRHLILPLALHRGRTLFVGVRRVCYPVSPLTVYRVPKLVVAVARQVREVLAESGLNRDKIRVIPSGVDLRRFRPSGVMSAATRRSLGIGREKVILNLAKFVPAQKGQHLLFQAARMLRGRVPLRIVLAGLETDGPEAKEMVSRYGLQGSVSLLGFRRDIPELINGADLFAFPSLPGLDAIAGSVLQAMACRKLTVAAAVGGIPEYLRDGENGFLVPPGDPEALAAAMERALALGAEEAEAVGRRAARTVEDGYSAGTMAERWIRLLREPLPAGN